MSKEEKGYITIRVEVGEYIRRLVEAKGLLCGPGGLMRIPEPVFGQFCGEVRDGTRRRIGGDGLPEAVIARLATEGGYGPVEEFCAICRPMLAYARKRYADGHGGVKPSRAELRRYVRGHREEAMEGLGGIRDSYLFWWRDDAGDYGISVCLSFGV